MDAVREHGGQARRERGAGAAGWQGCDALSELEPSLQRGGPDTLRDAPGRAVHVRWTDPFERRR